MPSRRYYSLSMFCPFLLLTVNVLFIIVQFACGLETGGGRGEKISPEMLSIPKEKK